MHLWVPLVLGEVACEHCLLFESQLLLCFVLPLEKATCPFCSSFCRGLTVSKDLTVGC